MHDNPLSKHFRQPSIYIPLPSKGEFYNGTLTLNPSHELAIYPMTALDEITYRTPDALYNGTATAEIIKSCAPGIQDPWIMPSMDLAAVLVAIRIASGGHEMEITAQCPKCKETNTYMIDLREILDSFDAPDYNKPHVLGPLKIYYRPLTYQEINENSKINYEEQRLTLQIQASPDVNDEDRIRLLSDAFQKVSKFTIETLAKNIAKIETPDQEVDDPKYILDFLQKCESAVYKDIKRYVIQERSKTDLKPLNIVCGEEKCKHEFQQPYTLDMSNFFE